MKTLRLMLVVCVVLLFLGCSWVPDLPWAGEEPTGENDDGADTSEQNASGEDEDVKPTEPSGENDNKEELAATHTPTPKPTEEVEAPRETDQEDDNSAPVAADSGIVDSLASSVGERGARVYAAAGSATTILRTLPAGTEVTLLSLSSNGVWVEVDPRELDLAASVREAWIPKRHLVELTDSESSSLFQHAPELTADFSAWIRLEPSKTASIMNSMEKGERAKILGMNEDKSWFEVEKENGRTGWIAASVVTLDEPESLKGVARFNPEKRDGVPPTPTLTPTPTATPTP